MPLTLRWRGATTLPVESDDLRPDRLAPLDAGEAARRPARIGRDEGTLGDLFLVEGAGADGHVALEGDLRHVRGIGAGMATGTLTIRGDAGHHLGAAMQGGTIVIDGSVGHWAGAEMRGGTIRVAGSAGDDLGGAYPGSKRGMRDGLILVSGAVGRDAGHRMRRGLIAARGATGPGVGRSMIAGSIFAFGPVGPHVGLGMKRGTIALFGPGRDFEPSATFASAGRHRAVFLSLYLKFLHEHQFETNKVADDAGMTRYNGDRLEGGQGEILVATDS